MAGKTSTATAARKRRKQRTTTTTADSLAGMSRAELEAACRAVLEGTAKTAAAGTSGEDGSGDRPGSARALAGSHAAVLAPFWWITQADLTALAAGYAVHHGGPGSVACGTAAATLTAWALTRTALRTTARTKDSATQRAARTAARRRAVRAWLAAAAWGPAAIWWTMTGPAGLTQEILVAGGVALAAGHLHAHRRRPRPRRAGLAVTARPDTPDERLELFRRRFIDRPPGARRTAVLAGAQLHDVAEVRDGQGFTFSIALDPASDITRANVVARRAEIAALYDVPAEQVLIDHTARRSESRAQVTVLTAQDAYADPEPWDGVSTYDPATGCIDLGRFGDGTTAHWRLHAPGSGSWGGIIVGAPGSGKTGTAHVAAAEAGLAELCPVCGPARSCPACDPRRICSIIMCDPQRQPLGPWRGSADLMAWGPEGCVLTLLAALDAMNERAAVMGEEIWTDSKGRLNTGRGWFDPTPARPELLIFIDEWHKVVSGPGGATAVEAAEHIEKEGRKVGVSLVWINQMPDAGESGDSRVAREAQKGFNLVAHRGIDGTSKAMLGIDGDPRTLPDGVHSVGYIGGYDGRSAATFRTKHLPETADPGQADVRDLAARIAVTPVEWDEPVRRAFARYGITARCQVIDDDHVTAWRNSRKPPPRQTGTTPAAGSASASELRPPAGSGPVSTGALDQVAAALRDYVRGHDGQAAELYDVMQATGLAAGPASRALASLVADGRARQAGPGSWAPARTEGATV